jgi:NADH-quinone oxidoreductase subunit N
VAVALFYYFRLVRSMFLLPATEVARPQASSLGLRIALGATGLVTLGAGIYPEPFLQLAMRSLLK